MDLYIDFFFGGRGGGGGGGGVYWEFYSIWDLLLVEVF